MSESLEIADLKWNLTQQDERIRELEEAIEAHRATPYEPGRPETVAPAMAHLRSRDEQLYAALEGRVQEQRKAS